MTIIHPFRFQQITHPVSFPSSPREVCSRSSFLSKHVCFDHNVLLNQLTVITAGNSGKIGAIGFCWGGRYALILGQENSPAKVDAVVSNHPCMSKHLPYSLYLPGWLIWLSSWIAFMVNADVEPIKSVPVAIFLGTKDDMLSVDGLSQVSFANIA